MTFQNLDSNFEKKVKSNSQSTSETSPEESHMKKTQPTKDKEKYESKMDSTLRGGLLSVFQRQLSEVRTEKKSDDSYDTINITADDIAPTTHSPKSDVSEEQIDSMLNTTSDKQTSIEEDLLNTQDIEIVTEKTQVKKQQTSEETTFNTNRVRYDEAYPVIEQYAKPEDAVSQIAVLRAANGEANTLGTDGKTLENDEIAYHMNQHRLKKEQLKKEGKSKSETTLNYEQTDSGIDTDPNETGLKETPLEEPDIF
jgi:hypothetical protein